MSLIIRIISISDNDVVFAQSAKHKVVAGGGNATTVLMTYTPNSLSIDAGDSMTWYNPTGVGEPQTITFIMDKNYFPPPAFPLSVSNTTVSNLGIPNFNVEPLIVSNNSIQNTITKDDTTTIVVDNSSI